MARSTLSLFFSSFVTLVLMRSLMPVSRTPLGELMKLASSREDLRQHLHHGHVPRHGAEERGDSMPIAPGPTTSSDFGIFSGTIASNSPDSFLSGSRPAAPAAARRFAMMMCLA